MHAQATLLVLRHRVHQMSQRARLLGRHNVVVAPLVHRLAQPWRRIAAIERVPTHRRHLRRTEPRAIHQHLAGDRRRLPVRPRHRQLEAAGNPRDRGHFVLQRDPRAALLRRCRIRRHEPGLIDDACRAGVQRGRAAHRRFQLAQARDIADHRHLRNAVLGRTPCHALQRIKLRLVNRDDQLADAVRPHAVRRAPFVQQRVALDAQRVLQRSGRIVDARMDDAAVVRTGLVPVPTVPVDDRDLPRPRQLHSHRQPHHARTNDRDLRIHIDRLSAGSRRRHAPVFGRRPESSQPTLRALRGSSLKTHD